MLPSVKVWVRIFPSGFTLVEILIALGLVAVVAGLALLAGQGLQEGALRARAEGEMAALAQALARYRATYGDYPQTRSGSDGAHELYLALLGCTGPRGQFFLGENGQPQLRRSFVQPADFQIGLPDGTAVDVLTPLVDAQGRILSLDREAGRHCFLDPWDRPYLYRYESVSSGWKRNGFLLFSHGRESAPDFTLPADGLFPPHHRDLPGAFDDLLYGE